MKCKRCQADKNENEFYKSKRIKSGYNSYCKACDGDISKDFYKRVKRLKVDNSTKQAFNWIKTTLDNKGQTDFNGLFVDLIGAYNTLNGPHIQGDIQYQFELMWKYCVERYKKSIYDKKPLLKDNI